MSSEFILGQGAGHKLELAIRRCGGSIEDIEYLSTGENFRAVTQLRKGEVQVVSSIENVLGEATLSTKEKLDMWTFDDEGFIYSKLTSNGFSWRQWEDHFMRQGLIVSSHASQMFRRMREAPTHGQCYKVVVCPGRFMGEKDLYSIDTIRAFASDKGWKTPHWEVACLVRDAVRRYREFRIMGLDNIVTMHEPIVDAFNDTRMFRANERERGSRFDAISVKPSGVFGKKDGFAFLE